MLFTHPDTIESINYRRPYLNFKEKVTQIFLNPYTVVLLIFIIKLIFFLNSLINSLEQARENSHLLYNSVEKYATNVVSFPHYMTKASNYMIAKALKSANDGLMNTLIMIMSASENLIYFMVELSVGTYACLLMAAIDNTAMAALNATENVITVANDTLQVFAHELNDGLQDLTVAINEVVDTAEDTGDALKHLFGGGSSNKKKNNTITERLHHVNLTISNMQDWKIPGNINDKIEKLKDEIPDFTDVQDYTKKVIELPFKELTRQVNANKNRTFDANTMYVPGIATLNFSNGTQHIDEMYTDLINAAKKTTHIIIGLICVSILLLLLYVFWTELKDWRRVLEASRSLNFTNESYVSGETKRQYNVEVIKTMQWRTADFISDIVSKKLLRIKNPATINNIRWVINYAASPYLFPFFLLGLLGLVSVICQYIILHFVSKVDVTSSSDQIFYSTKTEIYSSFNNSLSDWTNQTNDYISNYQNDVNDNLLAWVDTAATTVNNTVTEFDNKMNAAIDALFKGTPLYKPVEQIVFCVIESKIQKIQKAMTWLVNHAHLQMPNLDPKEILAHSAAIRAGDVSDSFDENIDDFKEKAKHLLSKTIQFYRRQCQILLYISLGILGIWFLFFMVGILILLLRERNIAKEQKRRCLTDSSDDTDSTLHPPFDTISHKSLLFENQSDCSTPRITQMMQSIRDQYLKRKGNYIRTPTDSKPGLESYLSQNYEKFTGDHNYETSFHSDSKTGKFEEKSAVESMLANTHADSDDDEEEFNQDLWSDSTVSIIEEHLSSIQNARLRTP